MTSAEAGVQATRWLDSWPLRSPLTSLTRTHSLVWRGPDWGCVTHPVWGTPHRTRVPETWQEEMLTGRQRFSVSQPGWGQSTISLISNAVLVVFLV